MADSPKQPTPTWYKALNVIIGIIALIMAVLVVFNPLLLGGGTVVIFLSFLLVFTGLLKTVHAYQYADYPNWLRWLTIIFGIILIVLALPLILIGTTETVIIYFLVFTLILIGILLMATNIMVATHTGTRRNILGVIAIILIVVAIAILVGNGLTLVVYVFLISIGFGFIALDAFAAGLIRD